MGWKGVGVGGMFKFETQRKHQAWRKAVRGQFLGEKAVNGEVEASKGWGGREQRRWKAQKGGGRTDKVKQNTLGPYQWSHRVQFPFSGNLLNDIHFLCYWTEPHPRMCDSI
jgi:hypothetical protein